MFNGKKCPEFIISRKMATRNSIFQLPTEMKEIFSEVNKIRDAYRTAPLGETLAALSLGLALVNRNDLSVFGVGVSVAVLGIYLTKKQFNLRERLEDSIRRHGYDDILMSRTIPAWCDRQTARVVAREHDRLPSYEALCKKDKHRMYYRFLPNF